jgi:hypothetical protein
MDKHLCGIELPSIEAVHAADHALQFHQRTMRPATR